MKRPDHIDLTETAPGEWSFVRLLRLSGKKWRRSPRKQTDASREAFFDSLESRSPDHKPILFENLDWPWVLIVFFTLPILVILGQQACKVLLFLLG